MRRYRSLFLSFLPRRLCSHSSSTDPTHNNFFDHFIQSGGKSNNMKFIEKVVIEVKGGSGGNGCIAHFELAPGKRRPTGGNGGRGGNVYIEADSSMSSLKFQTYHFNAGDGGHGGNDSRTGKRGKDIIIKVPCGTIVKERIPPEIRDFYGINDLEDLDYYNDDDDDDHHHHYNKEGKEEEDELLDIINQEAEPEVNAYAVPDGVHIEESNGSFKDVENAWSLDADDDDDDDEEEEDDDDDEYTDEDEAYLQELKASLFRTELMTSGQRVCVASGGAFGYGNKILAGSSKQRSRTLPKTKNPGKAGEKRSLIIELKLIADVALVGYPNAGKSTLIRQLTRAKPKVAPYKFTTLRPYLGVLKYNDGDDLTIAGECSYLLLFWSFNFRLQCRWTSCSC